MSTSGNTKSLLTLSIVVSIIVWSMISSKSMLICGNTVGVITRVISVAADVAVLGFTLWKTFHIFKMDEETRVTMRITTTLAYNGNKITFSNLHCINYILYRQYSVWVRELPSWLTLSCCNCYNRALLILNILMIILDTLSIAAVGVGNHEYSVKSGSPEISVVSRHHPVPRHSRCVSTASFGH